MNYKLEQIRIALVDDHKMVCQNLSEILRRDFNFCIVWTANSGVEAIEKIGLEQNIPDVLLLALSMKFMDGFEVLQVLQDSTMDPYGHSQIAKDNSDVLLTLSYDGGSYYNKNIQYEEFSWISDRYGCWWIGDTLYQITTDHLKWIVTNDIADKATLLAATTSNPSIGLVVEEISETLGNKLLRRTVSGYNNWNISGSGNDGRVRCIVYQNFSQAPSILRTNTTESLFIFTSRSLVRRLFGLWFDNVNANHSVSGSCTGGYFYSYDNGSTPPQRRYNGSWTADGESNYHTSWATIIPYGTSVTTTWSSKVFESSDVWNGNTAPSVSTSNITAIVSAKGKTATASCSK